MYFFIFLPVHYNIVTMLNEEYHLTKCFKVFMTQENWKQFVE